MPKNLIETSRGLVSERGRESGRYHFGDLYRSIPELTEGEDLLTYERMRRTDPSVAASLRSIELPIRRGTYDIQPPSNPTELEKEQATVLRRAFFDYLVWPETLRGAVTFLRNGFSVHEFTLENRGGYVLPRKIGFRPQKSILEDYSSRNDRGNLIQLTQRLDGRDIVLPRKKLVICTADAESREDWRGTSILYSAYKPWFIKEKLEQLAAVAQERWGVGIPILTLPEITDKAQAANLENDPLFKRAVAAVKALHGGEESYVVLPHGYDLKILDRSSRNLDSLPLMRELKQDIYTAMLALQMRLGGSDTTGSKALGVTFIDSFLHAVEAWAQLICDAFNYDLIRTLVNINWGPQERYPAMTVTNIYKRAIQEIAYLFQVGLLKPTAELITYIFEQFGIRIDNPEDLIADDSSGDNNNPGDNEDDDSEEVEE